MLDSDILKINKNNPFYVHPACIQFMLEVVPLEWLWMKVKAISDIKADPMDFLGAYGYSTRIIPGLGFKGLSAKRFLEAADIAWGAARLGIVEQLP